MYLLRCISQGTASSTGQCDSGLQENMGTLVFIPFMSNDNNFEKVDLMKCFALIDIVQLYAERARPL